MPAWILDLVLGYIADSLVKAEGQIQWPVLQAELDAKLKALLPSWLEPEVQPILDGAVALVEKVAGGPGVIAQLVQLIAAKNFSGLVSYLEQLIAGELEPVPPVEASALLAGVLSYKKTA